MENVLKILRVYLVLLLALGVTVTFTNCDAVSGDSSSSSSSNGGNGSGDGGNGGGGGGNGDAPSVDDIAIAWSTWGAGGQPLPDAMSCTVSGGTPDTVTISMGGDGLDPITYTLVDDGSNGDETSGDGIYTIQFVQDLGTNALWAVDNVGHYLTCDAENSAGSDSMTWVTAGEVVFDNVSGFQMDTLNVSPSTAASWGTNFLSGFLNNGSSYTVTDVPCGVYDLQACATGGGCEQNYGVVLACGGSYTWTLTP